MRKLIMLSIVFLLVIFTSSTSLAANYHVYYFEPVTQTFDGKGTRAIIWFALLDLDTLSYEWRDVVDHVDISINGSLPVSYYPIFDKNCGSRFRVYDSSGDGVPDNRENIVHVWSEYVITLPADLTPHPEGVYSYIIHFNDGSTLPADPETDPPLEVDVSGAGGLTGEEWPPVTIKSVDMDETTGVLTIEWENPTLPYPPAPDKKLNIRIDTFKKDGDRRYIQSRVEGWLGRFTSFRFPRFFADFLNSVGVEYFALRISTHNWSRLTESYTAIQLYAIDGYTIKLKRKDLFSKDEGKPFKHTWK